MLILTIIEDPGVAIIDRPGVILKPIKLADVSSLEPTAKFEANKSQKSLVYECYVLTLLLQHTDRLPEQTRKHSSWMCTAHLQTVRAPVATTRYFSCVGPQVNKFEQVSSVGHRMLL